MTKYIIQHIDKKYDGLCMSQMRLKVQQHSKFQVRSQNFKGVVFSMGVPVYTYLCACALYKFSPTYYTYTLTLAAGATSWKWNGT